MSEQINDGGPAFPALMTDRGWLEERGGVNVIVQPHGGMSLRDYFAGQAMTGLLAHPRCQMVGPGFEAINQQAAIEAYAIADAMLAARKEAPVSDPDIERIVSDVRMEWVRQGSPSRTEEEMMRRAAELAVAKEREKTAAILKLLIDAPHQEHFCTRLNDDEMKGIDAMKEWLSAYNRDIRAGKEVGSE